MTIKRYVELDDDALRSSINITFMDQFGYLALPRKEAIVMGEFGGLYDRDAHPKKTTNFTIEMMLSTGMAGGYMWSLDPEGAYQFNPADTAGQFTEGLLSDDWLTPSKEYLQGMAAMDKFKDLKMFPGFPKPE